jgi:hypothetical protein
MFAGEFERFLSQGTCLWKLTSCYERMRERQVSVNAFDAVRVSIATSTLWPGAVLTDAWGATNDAMVRMTIVFNLTKDQ